MPTISPNQPVKTILLENLSAIAPNQPTASEPSQFHSMVVAEPSQLQPTAAAEPSQLQPTTTTEPVVPTTYYNIRTGGTQ